MKTKNKTVGMATVGLTFLLTVIATVGSICCIVFLYKTNKNKTSRLSSFKLKTKIQKKYKRIPKKTSKLQICLNKHPVNAGPR